MRQKRGNLPDELVQRAHDFTTESCELLTPLVEKYGSEISFNGMIDTFAVILMACCRSQGPEHVIEALEIACENLVKIVEKFIEHSDLEAKE